MRVVIGEDEVLLREGLRHVLEGDEVEVLAAVGTATQLEREVVRHRPDLVVTDIRMPPSYTDEGLLAALRIRHAHPEIAVVVLSQHVQRRYAAELFNQEGGGFGYLLKQRIADVRTFTADLRRVAEGGTALDPEVVSVMMARASRGSDAVRGLTDRQLEVLGLMAEGRSNAAIAAILVVSEKAVVQHTSNIYDALGLSVDADDHRRVLAVIRYLESEGRRNRVPTTGPDSMVRGAPDASRLRQGRGGSASTPQGANDDDHDEAIRANRDRYRNAGGRGARAQRVRGTG